jgi:L-Ala-D/L-Glu epimerase
LKITHQIFQLPFINPFTISKGTKTHQPTIVVSIEQNGVIGYGEAPEIKYYNLPIEKTVLALTNKKEELENFPFTNPEIFWHFLNQLFPENSFLVCALDMAAWDLYGKTKHQPLHQILNLDIDNAPITDFTIGIDSIEKMQAKILDKPWPVYKIKLGTNQDIEIIQALRKITGSPFRIDANAAWSLQEAMDKIKVLSSLNVEFIEQPLVKDNWGDMKILYQNSSLPLFADEDCVSEADVEKCVGHFHGINIKLTKCGGITPAVRMIKNAGALGLKTMLGCMNESSIGSAAIAQLSPLVDYLDMDGPLLLKEDLASSLEINNGKFILDKKPGLGVQVNF